MSSHLDQRFFSRFYSIHHAGSIQLSGRETNDYVFLHWPYFSRLLDEDGGWETARLQLSFGGEEGEDEGEDEHVESLTKVSLLQTAFISAGKLTL